VPEPVIYPLGYADPAAIDALAAFGHGIRFNPDNDELSARSGSETLNYLALNLAHEIAAGKRTEPMINPELVRGVFERWWKPVLATASAALLAAVAILWLVPDRRFEKVLGEAE